MADMVADGKKIEYIAKDGLQQQAVFFCALKDNKLKKFVIMRELYCKRLHF